MAVKSGNVRKATVAVAAAVAMLLVLSARPAAAFLESGTLLTNAASATYMGGSQGTSVTYSATAKILVANPAVFLWKDCNPTYVQLAGGQVQYTICFSNGGANTAFSMKILDRIPNDAIWFAAGYSAWYVNLAGARTALPVSYCYDLACTPSSGPWAAGPPAGGENTATPLYLRWETTGDGLGIGRSGCITFAVDFY